MNTLMTAGVLLSEKISEISDLKGVYQLNNINDIKKTGKELPCVYVVYDGAKISNSADSIRDYKQTNLIKSYWLIIIVIRDIKNTLYGTNYRLDIDKIMTEILNKLMGYRPSKDFQPFQLEDLPSPDFSEGFGFFSLRFSTKHLLRKI